MASLGGDITELGGRAVDVDSTPQVVSDKAAGESTGSSKGPDGCPTGGEGRNGSIMGSRGHGTSPASGEEADKTSGHDAAVARCLVTLLQTDGASQPSWAVLDTPGGKRYDS